MYPPAPSGTGISTASFLHQTARRAKLTVRSAEHGGPLAINLGVQLFDKLESGYEILEGFAAPRVLDGVGEGLAISEEGSARSAQRYEAQKATVRGRERQDVPSAAGRAVRRG